MKQILLILAVLALAGCGKKSLDPILEKAVRSELKKPTGKLTEADLVKVTALSLRGTKITDSGLKEVAKLQKLETLDLNTTQITDAGLQELAKLQKLGRLILFNNSQITDVGVAELKKALPSCEIEGP